MSKTYYASLAHDALYQISDELAKQGVILGEAHRKAADGVFLELLRKNSFRLRRQYYWAVRAFGRSFWASKP